MAANVQQKTVLVTGGAGFIGSYLVHRLLKDGYGVAVLTKETTDMRRIADVLPGITVLHDDLGNTKRLKKLLEGLHPYGIFHCAASNIKQGIAAPEDDLISINFAGTVHLVQALQNFDYKFFINCGTYIEYGTKDDSLTESDSCEPGEIYALTKLAATLYCQTIARNSGKPIITFRIFSPYGPQMEKGRLVEAVVHHALKNEDISLTSPEIARDFIFIDDLVDLFMEAAEKASAHAGEVFNAGGGKETMLKELVERTLKLTASKSKILWGSAKAVSYDKGCQRANMKKTLSAFLWRPAIDVEAGIKKMVEWFVSRDRMAK